MGWLPIDLDRLLAEERVPDPVLRAAIRGVLRLRLWQEREPDERAQHARLLRWVRELRESPICVEQQAANDQHYEVPAGFYDVVLGEHLKYSSGLWQDRAFDPSDLTRAEEDMLALTAERALLEDGQRVLDLGCGWGSLSMFTAQRYPNSEVVAVSNSAPQKEHILARARARGVTNLSVVTADVADLPDLGAFDRVVSVEMFEHVRNYEALLARIAGMLQDDGALFVHHFAHERYAYPYADDGESDWMARHFFTGGQMPSADLLLYFQRDLVVDESWRVDGTHYAKTCEAWLARLDDNADAVESVLAEAVGEERASAARANWRVFFLACAELFAYGKGREWFVCHWRFKKRAS